MINKISGVRLPGQVKAAQEGPSNLLQDFVAGYDPFGVWTQQYGKANQIANLSEAEHQAKNAVGIAGGLIGGATLVPSVVSGGLGLLKSKGKDWSGFKAPFKQVRELTKARNAARQLRRDRHFDSQFEAIGTEGQRLLRQMQREYHTLAQEARSGMSAAEKARYAKEGYRPEAELALQQQARKNVLERNRQEIMQDPYNRIEDFVTMEKGLGYTPASKLQELRGTQAKRKADLLKQEAELSAKEMDIRRSITDDMGSFDKWDLNNKAEEVANARRRLKFEAGIEDDMAMYASEGDDIARYQQHLIGLRDGKKGVEAMDEALAALTQGRKDSINNLILGGGFGAAGAGIQYNVGRREGREHQSNFHIPKLFKFGSANSELSSSDMSRLYEAYSIVKIATDKITNRVY